jgi:large subunit ribosomal protein LX
MYEVRGFFKIGNQWKKFRKIVDAHNEKFAVEKTYSILGSNHKVRRNMIKIEKVEKVETEAS